VEPEIKARFTTVNGAQVTVTVTDTHGTGSHSIVFETWTCHCGSTGRRDSDGNKVRAGANEHARTCLVIPPETAT
jgi:hypothetical protein